MFNGSAIVSSEPSAIVWPRRLLENPIASPGFARPISYRKVPASRYPGCS